MLHRRLPIGPGAKPSLRTFSLKNVPVTQPMIWENLGERLYRRECKGETTTSSSGRIHLFLSPAPTLPPFPHVAEKVYIMSNDLRPNPSQEQRSWPISSHSSLPLPPLKSSPPSPAPPHVPINSAPPNSSPGYNCILFVPISPCASPFSYGIGFLSLLLLDSRASGGCLSLYAWVWVWMRGALIQVLKSQT